MFYNEWELWPLEANLADQAVKVCSSLSTMLIQGELWKQSTQWRFQQWHRGKGQAGHSRTASHLPQKLCSQWLYRTQSMTYELTLAQWPRPAPLKQIPLLKTQLPLCLNIYCFPVVSVLSSHSWMNGWWANSVETHFSLGWMAYCLGHVLHGRSRQAWLL